MSKVAVVVLVALTAEGRQETGAPPVRRPDPQVQNVLRDASEDRIAEILKKSRELRDPEHDRDGHAVSPSRTASPEVIAPTSCAI